MDERLQPLSLRTGPDAAYVHAAAPLPNKAPVNSNARNSAPASAAKHPQRT